MFLKPETQTTVEPSYKGLVMTTLKVLVFVGIDFCELAYFFYNDLIEGPKFAKFAKIGTLEN